MSLINWTSSSEEIMKVLREETPKALRWLHKKTNDVKTKNEMKTLAWQAELQGKEKSLPHPIEYRSKDGNQWLLTESVAPDGRIYDGMMIYGLTEKYMWTILPMICGMEWLGNSDYNGIVYTPHFFQRLYERVNIEQEDRIMALRNFLQLVRVMPLRVLDYGKRKKVLGRLKGCVFYGEVRGEVVVMKTVVTENILTEKNLAVTKGFRKMSDSGFNNWNDLMQRSFYEEKPVRWIKKQAKKYDLGKTMGEMAGFEIGVRLMAIRVLREYSKRIGYREDYVPNAAIVLYKDMVTDLWKKREAITFETLEPRMKDVLRKSYDDLNPLVLADTLKEMRKLCGDGKVDFDKFHFLASYLNEEFKNELKI